MPDPGVPEGPAERDDRHLAVCPLHLSDGPAPGGRQRGVDLSKFKLKFAMK